MFVLKLNLKALLFQSVQESEINEEQSSVTKNIFLFLMWDSGVLYLLKNN